MRTPFQIYLRKVPTRSMRAATSSAFLRQVSHPLHTRRSPTRGGDIKLEPNYLDISLATVIIDRAAFDIAVC